MEYMDIKPVRKTKRKVMEPVIKPFIRNTAMYPQVPKKKVIHTKLGSTV